MADINLTRIKQVTVGANLTKGMICYYNERKGVIAKFARFLFKRVKWDRLERIGYEVLPITRTDFKTPIGIAIDDHTILVNGNWGMPPATISKGRYL